MGSPPRRWLMPWRASHKRRFVIMWGVCFAACAESRTPRWEESHGEIGLQPRFSWRIRAGESDLTMPTHLAVQHGRPSVVLVTDINLPGVVSLDPSTGRILGSFRIPEANIAPHLIGTTTSGDVVVVYDAGLGTVVLLDRELETIRASSVEPPLMNPKAIAVLDDSSVVLSGGRLTRDSAAHGVHWLLASSNTLLATEPRPTVRGTVRARQIAAGGPLGILGRRSVMSVDATSGSVWEVAPHHARERLALQLGNAEVGQAIDPPIQDSAGGGGPWWAFPRVIAFAWSEEDEYVLVWSEFDSSKVSFLLASPTAVHRVAVWNCRATVATFCEDMTCLYLIGADTNGAPYVARAEVPSGVLEVLGPPSSQKREQEH